MKEVGKKIKTFDAWKRKMEQLAEKHWKKMLYGLL